MYFNSYIFIFLLVPFALVGYHTLNHFKKYRPALAWVVFASLVFYSWGNISLFCLIAASVAGNHICSLLIKKTGKKKLFGITGIEKAITAVNTSAVIFTCLLILTSVYL